MESFVQDSPFYSGRDLYWLRPKVELTLEEKLYYCSCIRRNRHTNTATGVRQTER